MAYIDISVPIGGKTSAVLSSLIRLGWDGAAMNTTINDAALKTLNLPNLPLSLDAGETRWRKVKGLTKFQQLKRCTVVVGSDMDLFKV